MNKVSIFTLKALRKIYAKTFSVKPLDRPECIRDANIASKLIYDKLTSDEPCMIARLGATELMTMVNYLGVHLKDRKNIFKYIKGQRLEWWWGENCLRQMEQWSGFFPPTIDKIEQFCKLMLDDMREVDILGSWLANEQYFDFLLPKDLIRIDIELMNPFFAEKPWTKTLCHKKVLVVHPFTSTIEQQFKKRKLLFKNSDILPPLELHTIRAIQSLGGQNEQNFKDWFVALNWMKAEIDKYDYDICLIGCGAYGFPLATHVKRQGKKAVHLGGSLQLLFGIMGKRWENPNYSNKYNYFQLINEYWVKPLPEEKPAIAQQIESACYW